MKNGGISVLLFKKEKEKVNDQGWGRTLTADKSEEISCNIEM